MKTIVCIEQANRPDKLSRLGQALGDMGLSKGTNAASPEEFVIQLLQKSLDNRFFCLRNTIISSLSISPVIILVGPVGVKIMQICEQKGIFQANESSLEELDNRTQKFRQVKPNPLKQCLDGAGALQTMLDRAQLSEIIVEPVLIFSEPGAHIHASGTAAKIVLSDAIERFGANIAAQPARLKPNTVELIISTFCQEYAQQTQAFQSLEKNDAFSLRDDAKPKPQRVPRLSGISIGEPQAMKKIRFTPLQQKLLSGLFFLAIFSLVALVLVMIFLN